MANTDTQYAPESRTTAFAGGATGTGLQPATSMQSNVAGAFHPSGVLEMANAYRTPNGTAPDTYSDVEPMDNFMRQRAKAAAGPQGSAGAVQS
jgi:hypothetical protein